MLGKAFIFINPLQAARFGHVGWGFALEEGDEPHCYFGSSDHLWRHGYWDIAAWIRYAHVPPEGDIDWWEQSAARGQMMQVMGRGHHIRYHFVKELSVAQARPERAQHKARQLARQGWSLFVNNCVHQTYTVLSEYGAQLPPPATPPLNLIPRRWFDAIEARTSRLIE